MMTKTEIQTTMIALLDDMIQDWDVEVEEITAQTYLAKDLNFSSVDIIQLVVSTEEEFHQKLGFDELLMKDGRYVDDLSLTQWVNFIDHKLNGGSR